VIHPNDRDLENACPTAVEKPREQIEARQFARELRIHRCCMRIAHAEQIVRMKPALSRIELGFQTRNPVVND
jgi:hypothetical protein